MAEGESCFFKGTWPDPDPGLTEIASYERGERKVEAFSLALSIEQRVERVESVRVHLEIFQWILALALGDIGVTRWR